jgi:hypothetical protein
MFKITFEFDENLKTIHNLKCEEITPSKVRVNSNGQPIVEVGENKLIISPEAVAMIGATAGDRISIAYIQKSKELTIPVIGKSEIFADKDAGNKLTKSSTVSFKGKQRTMLLEYGSIFKLEPSSKENVFNLIAITEDSSPELSSDDLKDETVDLEIDNFDELDKLPF